MKQCFGIDFSFGTRKFEVPCSRTSKAFSVSKKLFEVEFDKRAANARLRALMECVLETPASFAVRFCGTEEMRQMNLNFRGKNKPTDVLSFCRSNGPVNSGVRELGDILVCLPVCLAQAKRARISLSEEVERMLVHGLTHLLGFDHDRSEMSWKVQEALEKSMRNQLSRHFGKPKWCEVRK